MSGSCPRCGVSYPPGRFASCPTCLLEADVPEALIGGRLELIEEVGRGGMGSVWKAHDRVLDRTVAVKFLTATAGADPEARGRFEREARALARLTHPGIVAVHDVGREEGQAYIVMEYVSGRALDEILPLPPARAREVVLAVLEALAFAHGKGVVHRDVKPQNVLVDDEGRVRLGDFGIARLVGGDGTTLTRAGGIVGTPAYMAPEALAGAPPDPRMDVYAAGVLLHELLCGHRPGGEIAALPGGLEGIVRRAVAADPVRRYPSAAEMRADLAAAADIQALSPDERSWRDGVAIVHSLATAAALWAFLLSVTPRVLPPEALPPLVALRTETLPDGRIASRARFETWPILGAVAALAVAVVAHGMLRRHWRQSGLDRPQPDKPVAESRRVLVAGLVALALYMARRQWGSALPNAVNYVPIVGGLLELLVVFLAWTVVLEAWRTSRPLHREVRLWLGLGAALVPPVVDLAQHLFGAA